MRNANEIIIPKIEAIYLAVALLGTQHNPILLLYYFRECYLCKGTERNKFSSSRDMVIEVHTSVLTHIEAFWLRSHVMYGDLIMQVELQLFSRGSLSVCELHASVRFRLAISGTKQILRLRSVLVSDFSFISATSWPMCTLKIDDKEEEAQLQTSDSP